METAFGKSGADFAIKRLGEDRVVTGCKRSAMIGKANVIAGPAMGDQRVHQPAVRGFDIAVEERPDVIAADRLAPLHPGDIEIGAHAATCQRPQPRRPSATRATAIMATIHQARKRYGWGTSVSGRADRGGTRIMKNNKKKP